MKIYVAATQLDSTVNQARDIMERLNHTYFNARSVIALTVALVISLILGRIIAALLRAVGRQISRRADKAENLQSANRLRRYETMLVIAVALIKTLLVAAGLYLWWIYVHPTQQPTALVGASALVILILSATIGPILRDIAYGGVMMAEHWFGVGDFVKIEPFADMRGIVERVTLRSTRIRGLTGEIIWVNNQNITGIRVLPRGVRTIAIDVFVTDLEQGLKVIEEANLQLPISQLTVIKPLRILSEVKVGPRLWHIVAISETAPGREWMLEDYALKIIKEVDENNKKSILATEPIARSADSEADRRLARTVQNARKSTLKKKRLPLPETLVDNLAKTSKEAIFFGRISRGERKNVARNSSQKQKQ